MAFIAPIVGIAGAVLSAVGTIAQGVAQKNALLYQQQVAYNNAKQAREMAVAATQAGEAKASRQSLIAAEQGGAVLASQAAGGVDVNTGSNKAVQVSQRQLGALDTQTKYHDAQLQAWGYRQQASNFEAQGGLYGYEAPQALTGAELGAAGQAFGTSAKWLSPVPTA